MEKPKSFLRRSLSKALNLPWFAAKGLENSFEKNDDWQHAKGRAAVDPLFQDFGKLLAQHCADQSAAMPDTPWLSEFGTLDSGAAYFYFQRFDEEGVLIEQTDHGWFSIPAVKVVADDSFIRGQVVAETATVMVEASRPDQYYVRSTIIGKHPVVLPLYADTYIEAFG